MRHETGVSLRSRSDVARLVARASFTDFYDSPWTQSTIILVNYFTNWKDYVPFWNAIDSWRTLVKDMNRLNEINRLLKKHPDCKWLLIARDTDRGLCAAQFCMGVKDTIVGSIQFGMLIGMATGNAELVPAYLALSNNKKVSLIDESVLLMQTTADAAYENSIANDPEALGGKNSICPNPDLVNPPTKTDPFADPSGYVYEAVPSNRVEGATATAIQRVTLYDMYDEPYTEDRVWDADAFGQVNPQKTNASGEFAWDVPEGLWSVKVSKSGYDDVQTDWMEVPPEYKDVHIALVSYDKPYVQNVELTDEGIEVTFEKYVVADQLAKAFTLTVNGEAAEVAVSSIDAEKDAGDRLLVRQALVVPAQAIEGAGEVKLTVSGGLQSYAGVSVGEDLTYDVATQRGRLEAPEAATLLKGATLELAVTAAPSAAMAGRPLTAEVTGGAASVEAPEELDENGAAVLVLKGLADGEATVRLGAGGATAEVRVICVDPDVYESVRLPNAISEIDAEAFAGSGAEIVVIPDGCTSIGSRAFADCAKLKYVVLPAGTEVAIADDAFQGSAPAFLYAE